jgi:long-chain acyl-CoA synthetase
VGHPSHWARVAPERTALRMAGSGESLTYAALDAGSNRVAHLLRRAGLHPGNGIVILMENHLRFLEICWGAQRSGLYFTPVSWRAKAAELAYIFSNSGARAVFASARFAAAAREAADAAGIPTRFCIGGVREGMRSYEEAVRALPATAIADECLGREMLYSSGTTGRPKGVKGELPAGDLKTIAPAMAYLTRTYGFDQSTVNLTPAPLYHAGPLRYSLCIGHTGGTNIIMEHFDAAEMLALIERYSVTHVELVPTMFVRLMKLTETERRTRRLASLRRVIHGTGPCAPAVKRAMIEWLGPILEEQYGGTEGNGLCVIDSANWLRHPCSVGRAAVGRVHIVGPSGEEVPVGEDGLVYFEGGPRFEYHGDPAKTALAYNDRGWSTLGDMGHLDAEGYLYLADRQVHVIISGGVNIYPREVEDVLIEHPAVLDVAVIGMPDEDLGERVIAIVHPAVSPQEEAALEAELLNYCRERISSVKGKLYKQLLRERYALGQSLGTRTEST